MPVIVALCYMAIFIRYYFYGWIVVTYFIKLPLR